MDMARAYELMKEGNLQDAGDIYRRLYAALRMNTYRQRLAKKRFDKVFGGLMPEPVFVMLFNKVAYHMNSCEAEQALQTIFVYRKIEKDFSIHFPFDIEIDFDEIELYRRLGDNVKALALCDIMLKKQLDSPAKVDLLITKGSIESDESRQVFGINSLSLALAEAEADGTPELIAKCYMEMAKMIGIHYPSLGLSFLWKARVFYEAAGDRERASFTKSRMALSYFILWHEKKDERFIDESRRLVNEEIKREDFEHPGAQYSFDRLKGLITDDISLIKKAIVFFESIHAYGEVLRSAEFYIKACIAQGNRSAAKEGAKLYEQASRVLNDTERLAYIRSIDLDVAEPSWTLEKKNKDLPDLLDVLEDLAYDEEWFHLEKGEFRSLYPTHYQEGMFSAVMYSDGKARLYPCSLYPYRYFRGQSDKMEGKACKPSLFRDISEEEVFHERLLLKEFENLLQYYPITKVFEGMMQYNTPEGLKPLSLNVDYIALAQHYGIKTNVLDLTADKWVAAFFASTVCKDGEYQPCTSEGEGVFYIYRHMPVLNETSDRLSAVGLQPFSRPGCQAALVYRMEEGEDFNNMAERVVFKHDPAISELIFNYCNRSKKLFPDEILENKVSELRTSTVFSRWALTNTLAAYYQDASGDTVQKYIDKLGICFQSALPVLFTQKDYSAFSEKWNREKDHFFDSVLLIPTVVYDVENT